VAGHEEAVMIRVKKLAIAAFASATVAAAGLCSAPSAEAMPMSCTVRLALAETYIATGNVFYSIGSNQQASYWYGRARGIMEGC
jgi:hypothetical protein